MELDDTFFKQPDIVEKDWTDENDLDEGNLLLRINGIIVYTLVMELEYTCYLYDNIVCWFKKCKQ